MYMLLSFLALCVCAVQHTGASSVRLVKYTAPEKDIGSFYAEIEVGDPPQKLRVQVDTGSSVLAVPAVKESCAKCTSTGNRMYDPRKSTTMDPVPCHSNQCSILTEKQEDRDRGVPTVCMLKSASGFPICPHAKSTAKEDRQANPLGSGGGQCKMDPKVKPGPAVQCVDHLKPPCDVVVNQYHYPCETDLSKFDASQAGTKISDVCPQTCNKCSSDYMRFCADNAAWKDAKGQDCGQYKQGGPLHGKCFASQAYIACPEACAACGDCCTADDQCYFYEHYLDDDLLTGKKVLDDVAIGIVHVTDAVISVYDHVSSKFVASADVDGVLGLSSAIQCNPACSDTLWDTLTSASDAASPWSHQKLFALCLPLQREGGTGSLDIGSIVESRYTGKMTWMPTLKLQEDGFAFTGLQDIKIGTASMLGSSSNSKVGKPLTQKYLESVTVKVDSGETRLLLPARFYAAFASTFLGVKRSLNNDTIDCAKFFITSEKQRTLCTGPVKLKTYNTDDDAPTLTFMFKGGVELLISGSNYLMKNQHPPSMKIKIAGRVIEMSVPQDSAFLCSGIGLSPVEDELVLGGAFLQSFYTVFDIQNKRVGFATAADCTVTNAQMHDTHAQTQSSPTSSPTEEPREVVAVTATDSPTDTPTPQPHIQPTQLPTDTPTAPAITAAPTVVPTTKPDPCASNPCHHNSVCVRKGDNFYRCCEDAADSPDNCLCPPGFATPYENCATTDDTATEAAGGCRDTPNWNNGAHNGCAVYAKVYCDAGSARSGKEWTLGAKWHFPEKNCCVTLRGANSALCVFGGQITCYTVCGRPHL